LEASSREAGAAAELAASNKMVKYICCTLITGRIRPDCGGVPRVNQQGFCSVLERVVQAIGGNDQGCSRIFVFVSTDFRRGATI